MKPCLQTFFTCGLDMNDPYDPRWHFAVKTVPVGVGVSFDHEPTAEEMEQAWDIVNEAVKKKWMEIMSIESEGK